MAKKRSTTSGRRGEPRRHSEQTTKRTGPAVSPAATSVPSPVAPSRQAPRAHPESDIVRSKVDGANRKQAKSASSRPPAATPTDDDVEREPQTRRSSRAPAPS